MIMIKISQFQKCISGTLNALGKIKSFILKHKVSTICLLITILAGVIYFIRPNTKIKQDVSNPDIELIDSEIKYNEEQFKENYFAVDNRSDSANYEFWSDYLDGYARTNKYGE